MHHSILRAPAYAIGITQVERSSNGTAGSGGILRNKILSKEELLPFRSPKCRNGVFIAQSKILVCLQYGGIAILPLDKRNGGFRNRGRSDMRDCENKTVHQGIIGRQQRSCQGNGSVVWPHSNACSAVCRINLVGSGIADEAIMDRLVVRTRQYPPLLRPQRGTGERIMEEYRETKV